MSSTVPLATASSAQSSKPSPAPASVKTRPSSSSWTKPIPWTPAEDALLVAHVRKHGPMHWGVISAAIPGRSSMSCRFRWWNQLNPDVHHRPFTPQEDAAIIRGQARFGNKWTAIASTLPGRSDNSVKNRWNSCLRKRLRPGAVASSSAATTVALPPPPPPEYILLEDDDEDDSGKEDEPPEKRQAVASKGAGAVPFPVMSLALSLYKPPTQSLMSSPLPLAMSIYKPPTSPTLSLMSSPLPVEERAPEEATAGMDDEKRRMSSNAQLMAAMRQMLREELQLQTGQIVCSLMAAAATRANGVQSDRPRPIQ